MDKILMTKYGPKSATKWRITCLDHIEHCDDPKCHVKQLMRLWNELSIWDKYRFPEDKIRSSEKTEEAET